MEISKIGTYTQPAVANSKNRNIETKPVAFGLSEDKVELPEKPKKASNAKKWGVGIASGMISGLGQLINGEVGKGAGYFGASVGTFIIARVGMVQKIPALAVLGGLGNLAVGVSSIVDAVKHAKSE